MIFEDLRQDGPEECAVEPSKPDEHFDDYRPEDYQTDDYRGCGVCGLIVAAVSILFLAGCAALICYLVW